MVAVAPGIDSCVSIAPLATSISRRVSATGLVDLLLSYSMAFSPL